MALCPLTLIISYSQSTLIRRHSSLNCRFNVYIYQSPSVQPPPHPVQSPSPTPKRISGNQISRSLSHPPFISSPISYTKTTIVFGLLKIHLLSLIDLHVSMLKRKQKMFQPTILGRYTLNLSMMIW